jgi:uncharacterized protein involved in outer membrane biogenesis
MKPDNHSQPVKRASRARLLGFFLVLLLALLTGLLLAPRLIDSAAVKHKIQRIVSEQIGGRIDYQSVNIDFLPRPTISLQQASLSVPERLQGKVEALSIVPKLLPLLTGDLHLARIELEAPDLNLTLPATSGTTADSYDFTMFQKSLATILEPLRRVTPTLKLMIDNGQFTVQRGKQKIFEIADLKLQINLLVVDPGTAQASLEAQLDHLALYRAGHREPIHKARLEGTVRIEQGELHLQLNRLSLAEPALELNGALDLAPNESGVTLKLSGREIDVDATRRVALALAGDISPVASLFDYLRGGRVPQISIDSQSAALQDLGDLQNLHIAGQLQDGAVSIPQIKLDLTEVTGDVVIDNGILDGSKISTRLEGSTGHDGTIKVALGEGNDLFQMELMLNADLGQAHRILKRIVKDPTFTELIDKIHEFSGNSTGKLVLGNSLADIRAQLDITDFNFTLMYQGVPFPIGITYGQLLFTEQLVKLKGLQGTFGHSDFKNVVADIAWLDSPELDIHSGKFSLDLDELYPWVSSFESMQETLREIDQLTGHLNLSSVSFHGTIDQPGQWQVSATGSVQELGVVTPRFPGKVTCPQGGLKYADQVLSLNNLRMIGLDADLTVSGALSRIPSGLEKSELVLEGVLGSQSIGWLYETFDVPETYTLRTPLTLSGTTVLWESATTTSFSGTLAIDSGPVLGFDVTSQPERLQVKQLTIKDGNSDARMTYLSGQGEKHLDFSGSLANTTLEALFAEPLFNQGHLDGDISISVPQADDVELVAHGHLQGEGIALPLPEGHRVEIEEIDLDANGNQIGASLTSLSWLDLTWQPIKASIDFNRDQIVVKIEEAKLCGIDSPGTLTFAGREVTLDTALEGKELDVSTSYTCLTGGKVKMTGSLDIASKVVTQGAISELVNNLRGPLEMTFSNGVIEKDKTLARILEALNITDIVKGRLPNLSAKGFAYTSIDITGTFKDGKLIIKKFFMDGETLDVLGHGELDIEKKIVNIELLASPFQTVDSVIRHIPGINYLLAGSLVAIPVSVKGDLYDPEVRVLSASAVGSSLLGLAERTLKAPVKLIETIVDDLDKK